MNTTSELTIDMQITYYNYKVKVDFTAGNKFEKEFNDDFYSATPITVGKEYNGTIIKSSEKDYYKLRLDKPGKFTACINTEGAKRTNNITLAILDGKNNTYASFGKKISLMGDECTHVGLDAGEYYIKAI
ncbi:hypothetical protein [Oceanobacillus alkalisoli]|uniref:hypothetical protein n=1 Tax=Oceanobacillus alkalisoli TaxID=2925113 RepID=UPI001EF0B711|nr:hypothetical protein [Oceanobacillus alkalisoli]MCF3942710.1 hypothetical protein [Oceanobacillus alkalisoli]MCG5102682.1 hypothetical protein [Oceanobacillus alkalisoli]